MKILHLILLVLLMFFTACAGKQEEPQAKQSAAPVKADWAGNALWDDGLAEVAEYEAKREIYGKVREFEYVHILVKEEFNREHNVKTDDYRRNDLFTVMKVNKFARIPTEKYPYHFLTSLFFRREQPATLHKMTHSSQEWCGNTFKQFDHVKNRYRYVYSSYWDEEGVGQQKLKDSLWFEDALSYTLRALDFRDGLEFRQEVVESQINNKAGRPAIYNALFKVSNDQLDGLEAWKVQMQPEEDKISTYWFAKDYPNILLKQETHDGNSLRLKETHREAYWE